MSNDTTTAGTQRPAAARGLRLVNPDPRYPKAPLIEPTGFGYIHLAAAIQPRPVPVSFILPNGRTKAQLLARLRAHATHLEALEGVRRVRLFDALAIPPAVRRSRYLQERGGALHVPRFDVVALIETESPDAAREIQATTRYQELVQVLRDQASDLHITLARNVRRIDDVPERERGLYIFNYFVGDDRDLTIELWEHLAGWFVAETGLTNSILLAPAEGERADYTVINYAYWDESLPRLLWQQFSKPSFRSYVLANLDANRVGVMPVLYRPAGRQAAGARALRVAAVAGITLATVIAWRARARRR